MIEFDFARPVEYTANSFLAEIRRVAAPVPERCRPERASARGRRRSNVPGWVIATAPWRERIGSMRKRRGIEMDPTSPRPRRAIALAVAAALSTSAPPALAEPERGTLSLVFENDVFYGSDHNYTNGVRVSWLSGPGRPPDLAVRAASLFPLFPHEAAVRAGYAVGQSMYTPDDIKLRDPPLDDRPYGGWLYGTIGLIAETGKRLDQLELTLGVVGPASFADETQKFVHDVIDSDHPNGWHTQLRNEPGVVLAYQRSERRLFADDISGFGFDVTPHGGGALGNVFTYADVGLTLRVGHNLPLDYGPPRVQPSLPGSGFFDPQGDFGWYLFAGVEGRAVARNIFLDGNTFRDSRSVDKRPLVGDFQFGFAVNVGNVRFSYTHVLRSREFEHQKGGDDFGAVSLSARF
jgi:hypothetical protein